MKLFKEILGRFFALWGFIVFIPTLIVAFILIALAGLWKEPGSTKIFQQIARVWMRLFFFLVGIRIRLKGKEHFKEGKNYVIICNHNSYMDIPLTTPFIPGANKTIAKKELAQIPLFGLIYKRGSILVDRKSEASRKASLENMKRVLALGMHMCIYPEGTRNTSDKPLQPFHSGAFRLAKETGKPVLPAVIFNSAKVLPKGKPFFFWPAKIKMHFLEPILPEPLTMEELKREAFTRMESYYVQHR